MTFWYGDEPEPLLIGGIGNLLADHNYHHCCDRHGKSGGHGQGCPPKHLKRDPIGDVGIYTRSYEYEEWRGHDEDRDHRYDRGVKVLANPSPTFRKRRPGPAVIEHRYR